MTYQLNSFCDLISEIVCMTFSLILFHSFLFHSTSM